MWPLFFKFQERTLTSCPMRMTRERDEGRRVRKPGVDDDAVFEESVQAAALHANQISQLRGLFVRWHRCLLRARTLLRGAFTDAPHRHTQEATDTLVPINTHGLFSAPLLALSFFCLSCFSAWLQSLCLLFPDSFHLLCALCLSLLTEHLSTSTYGIAVWSTDQGGLFLEEVIHHISNVEMTVVRQNTPWAHTNRHMLLCLEEQRPEPAGSHNSKEEEEYQTTGSFFCRGLQKHGRHHTAGALLERTRNQPPLRFHSHDTIESE